MRVLKLILSFYKSFAFLSLLITLSSVSIAFANGFGVFAILFWFKILTLGLIFYYINNYKRAEFYYFKNLGISKLKLWVSTLLFDIVLFIALLIVTIKIR